MILLALMAILLDGVVTVPPSHWRAVEVEVPKAGAIVEASFTVPADDAAVEAILVTRKEADRFHAGKSYKALSRTGYQTSARLRYEVDQAGRYILLLDNRIEGRRATPVSVKINVREPASVIAITVPPQRRAVIIFLSLLFFVAVVMYSARQFMR
jgi:hypothetical protein